MSDYEMTENEAQIEMENRAEDWEGQRERDAIALLRGRGYIVLVHDLVEDNDEPAF